MKSKYWAITALGLIACAAIYVLNKKPAHEKSTNVSAAKIAADSQPSHEAKTLGARAASNQAPNQLGKLQPSPRDIHLFHFGIDHIKRNAAEIPVSPTEWQQIGDAYGVLVKARQDYELSIAHVTKVNEHENFIEIPPYADFGNKLKDSFYMAIKDAVGHGRADQLWAKVRPISDIYNGYWGAHPQSLYVKYIPDKNTYEIVSTVEPTFPTVGSVTRAIGSKLSKGYLSSYEAYRPLFPN